MPATITNEALEPVPGRPEQDSRRQKELRRDDRGVARARRIVAALPGNANDELLTPSGTAAPVAGQPSDRDELTEFAQRSRRADNTPRPRWNAAARFLGSAGRRKWLEPYEPPIYRAARAGAGRFSGKRSAHVLHLRAHPFELGEDRIDAAAILLEVGATLLADAIELLRALGFDRGVTEFLEIRQRRVNHPGTGSVKAPGTLL